VTKLIASTVDVRHQQTVGNP